MDIDAIRNLAAEDMAAVNRLIQERLSSEVVLINQMGNYIVNSGGKRLRPLLVLLAARAAGYSGDQHIKLAAVVEFIHTATLLHDDVVDESTLRRGQGTANSIWGNEAAVLVGDFLYTRSFEMMVEVGLLPIMQVMARTTNTIAEGEVMQLLNCHDPDVTQARYRDVIYRKTASLFEAACCLGGTVAGLPQAQTDALSAYGLHLGTAYQLVDDALDYAGKAEEIGKNIGDDLAEGKPTMPLIHAMGKGSDEEREVIREAISEGGMSRIEAVQQAIENTGAIPYTLRLARDEAEKAVESIASLTTSEWKTALEELARSSVARTY